MRREGHADTNPKACSTIVGMPNFLQVEEAGENKLTFNPGPGGEMTHPFQVHVVNKREQSVVIVGSPYLNRAREELSTLLGHVFLYPNHAPVGFATAILIVFNLHVV